MAPSEGVRVEQRLERLRRMTPTVRLCLFIAHRGRCFHCGGAMVMSLGRQVDAVASDEHMLPLRLRKRYASTSRFLACRVLAHKLCNEQRDDRDATPEEWARAAALWRQCAMLWYDMGGLDGDTAPEWHDWISFGLEQAGSLAPTQLPGSSFATGGG